MLQLRLALTDFRIRKLKAARSKRQWQVWEDELAEAWNYGRCSLTWSITRRISIKCKGSKVRNYGSFSGNPTISEWLAHVSKPGFEGGMAAKQVDWHSEKDKIMQDPLAQALFGSTQEQRERALGDEDRIIRWMAKAAKRRSVPLWSAPLEVWLLVFRPSWKAGTHGRVGHKPKLTPGCSQTFPSMFGHDQAGRSISFGMAPQRCPNN